MYKITKGKQNTHCKCTKLPKNEQLKPSKKPKLPAARLSGEEENKKKKKIKEHVVRTEEKKKKARKKI